MPSRTCDWTVKDGKATEGYLTGGMYLHTGSSPCPGAKGTQEDHAPAAGDRRKTTGADYQPECLCLSTRLSKILLLSFLPWILAGRRRKRAARGQRASWCSREMPEDGRCCKRSGETARVDSQATDQEAPTATLADLWPQPWECRVTSVEGRQGLCCATTCEQGHAVGTQVLRSGAVDLG